jgi:hypothetical protein
MLNIARPMQRYDKSAQYVLVCLILGFVSVLSIGWGEMLSQAPTFFFFPPTGWAVAVLIALFAIFLARAVASERLRLKQTKDSAFRFAWLAYFVILLGISAVGTANFMYEKVFSEGSEDRNQVLREVRAEFNKLRLAGLTVLSAESVQEKVREIQVLSQNLQKEILNPNRCGHGPEAKKIEQQLKTILGSHYAPTSGGAFMDSCSQAYADIYQEAVDRAIPTWQEAQKEWRLEKEFKPMFLAAIAEQVALLNEAEASSRASAFEAGYRGAEQSHREIRSKLIQVLPRERQQQAAQALPEFSSRENEIRSLKGNAYNKVFLIAHKALAGETTPLTIVFLALIADIFLVQAYGRHLYSLSREDDTESSASGHTSSGVNAIFKALKRNRS